MMIRYYSPIQVMLEDSDFGDYIEITNEDVRLCYEEILTEIVKYNEFMNEKGLMEYFDDDDEIKEIVESAKPMIGVRKGEVCGVLLVKIKDGISLTTEQEKIFKDYIRGQYSDGWGEGFEQQDIKTSIGTINVHFWQGDNFWIKSENELDEKIDHSKNKVTRLREEYPVGTVVQLLDDMSGEIGMPEGLKGTVTYVDDIGNIQVEWENGRNLSIIPEQDSFKKINFINKDENMNISF